MSNLTEFISNMTIAQMREFAAVNNIDLGRATRRQDIMDIILAAATPPKKVAEQPETSEAIQTTPEDEKASEDENKTVEDEAGENSKIEDNPGVVQNAVQPPENTPPADNPKTDENQQVEFTINRILQASRLLMTGDDVAAVHAALVEKGFNLGNEQQKGIYGARTALAIRQFQSLNRLIVTGRVDKFTVRALGLEWGGE